MAQISLEPRLNTSAAEGLEAALQALQGEDVTIDCAAVKQLGGLCFEVLLTATLNWKTAGKTFSFENISEAMSSDIQTFGLDLEQFSAGLSA